MTNGRELNHKTDFTAERGTSYMTENAAAQATRMTVDGRVARAVRDDFERIWHKILSKGYTGFQQLKIQRVTSHEVVNRTYPWAWNSVLKLTSKTASQNQQAVISRQYSPFDIVRPAHTQTCAHTLHTGLNRLLICS